MEKLTKELELQKKMELVEKSNNLLSYLRRKIDITEDESNYFKFNF